MTKKDTGELIDLVIEKAPKLRELGVLELAVGDVSITLAPTQPAHEKTDAGEEERKRDEAERREDDIWQDPETFGRRNSVPRSERKKEG